MKRVARAATFAAAVIAGASLTAGCQGTGDDVSSSADDGSKSGELAVYISDTPDGLSQTHYFLKDAAGRELPLLFDSEPDIAPNSPLKVWGAAEGEALRVTSFARLPGTQAVSSALIGAAPFAPRTFAFILVDIGNGFTNVRGANGSSVPVTPDYIMGRMQNDPDSIRNYYLGDSYQTQDITTTVVGPLTYTPNACDTSAMASALRPMVDAQGGPFNHYLWYYGSMNTSCQWSGLASVGTPDRPSKDTWYNASTSCVVLVQEPGHNFGMQHSSSITCGTSAPFADDPNTCTNSEYGDRFDPMGGGCRHMNAWQKSYQGWFSGCNGVRVTNSGTFNLVPYEPSCNGVQFLQVKAPKTRTYMRPAGGGGSATTENLNFYYLELRTPVDFDGTLGNSSALTARVLVHVADDLHTRTQRGVHPFILDMTPSTTGSSGLNDAGLAVGQSFTDPAGGLTITNMAMSNSGATIQVTYTAGSGDPTCMDGTAFTPPGPGVESCTASAPTGAGGTGGTTGAGGRGGAGGSTAGRGGTTGTGGTAVSGTGGTTGGAGTTGTGGTTSSVGTGGATGAAGTTEPMDRGVAGGCGCDTAASGSESLAATLLLLAALGLTITRRPRARVVASRHRRSTRADAR
ncbi:MAG TPA: hypothetical protein VKQ32_02585 [Polyangia bacterium]|nr:hypothetical protein [Polyangia bacterium]